jgi:signal peptidase I
MTPRRLTVAGVVIGGVVAVGLWAFFAPTRLGGSTDYSITTGISMEPMLHANDLALVRAAPSYHVGDVVLYQSQVLHRPVLHRIILIQNGNYFFKGENNDFVDPGYATQSELVGKLWLRVPWVGGVLGWFGRPLHAGLLAGLAAMVLVLAAMTARTPEGRRRRAVPVGTGRLGGLRARSNIADDPSPSQTPDRRVVKTTSVLARERRADLAMTPHQVATRRVPPYFAGPAPTLTALYALLVSALVLLGVGFSRPLQRVVPLPNAFDQTGTFSYSAIVTKPTTVYPSGLVTTGQPIYPDLVDSVALYFGYRFSSALPHHIRGTIELKALLLSQSDTWQDLTVVKEATAFTGDSTAFTSDLQLAGLYTLISDVSTQAGRAGVPYSADIQPVVHITGTVGGKVIDERFSPVLPFTVSTTAITLDVAVQPAPPGATYVAPSAGAALASALHPAQAGSVPHLAANWVSVGRYLIPVALLRWLGIVLGVLALAVAVFHDRLRRGRAMLSDDQVIARRFHSLIVPVISLARDSGPDPVEVPDFARLAGLAQFLQRPILSETTDHLRTYAVDDGSNRYVTRRALAGTSVAIGAAGTTDRLVERPTPGTPARHRRPRRSTLAWTGAGILLFAAAATLTVTFTASTSVPASRAGASTYARQVAQLAPAGCGSLALTTIVQGSGTFSNNVSHALVLGSANRDTITDSGQGNCIVGGGGNDRVTGTATDICIIGPSNGTKYDICVAKP